MPAGMRGREGNMKKKLLGLVACVATLALSGALLAGCSGSGDKTGGDSADGKETLTVGFDQKLSAVRLRRRRRQVHRLRP